MIFFCSIFFLMEKFHGNCNFLANGCFVGQNSRKETPLKIKFYYQNIINLPVKTFSKAWKCIGFIFEITLFSDSPCSIDEFMISTHGCGAVTIPVLSQLLWISCCCPWALVPRPRCPAPAPAPPAAPRLRRARRRASSGCRGRPRPGRPPPVHSWYYLEPWLNEMDYDQWPI